MSTIYIVMGVSGVGKTTIGERLAALLKVPFYDADDFHPIANKEKMTSGMALNDDDRWPWLDHIVHQYTLWKKKGAVLACSALKESYRERLQVDHHTVKIIYLLADFKTINKRLSQRESHFFNSDLLQSQFDTLEEPQEGIICNANADLEDVLNQIMNTLTKPTHSQLGLIGLGIMGKSLSRNFANNAISLSLYNRHLEGIEENVAKQFIAAHQELSTSKGFDDIKAFVDSLAVPRKIFLMVHAGKAVDAVIQGLIPHLSEGDIIMDGGNSHYKDTQSRFDQLNNKGIHFLGVGVSGGEKGALEGPSIMPSGRQVAYNQIGTFLETIAARDRQGNACCTRVGDGGSGHFVKMIHNGIEYAEMQLIAEVYDVLKTNKSLDNEDISNLFKEWNSGELESYLLEISSHILSHKEGNHYLIDRILDKAKQKGTGGWSTTAALEIGAPLDTISQSVMARIISGYKEERVKGEALYMLSPKPTPELSIQTIKKAYQTARMINHCIGVEALRKASGEYNWNLNLSEITRIWTNGCIIRSKFMERLEPILKKSNHSLFLDDDLSIEIKEGVAALIALTSTALQGHTAVPVFSAAVQYILAYTRGESSANMIQAQRDYFGAHTYERKDKPGHFHTQWED